MKNLTPRMKDCNEPNHMGQAIEDIFVKAIETTLKLRKVWLEGSEVFYHPTDGATQFLFLGRALSTRDKYDF